MQCCGLRISAVRFGKWARRASRVPTAVGALVRSRPTKVGTLNGWLLRSEQGFQLTQNFVRLPFVPAIQPNDLSVSVDDSCAQRVDDLLIARLSVVIVAKPKKLRDAVH